MAQKPNKTESKEETKKSDTQVQDAPQGQGQPNAESSQSTAAASTKPETPSKPKAAAVKVLRVTARRPSFRRAGIAFGRTEKVLRLDELTKEQVKAIKAEPQLLVREDTEEAEG